MKSVFIDESGYTGTDLLNKDQPFQAASAICITEEEAKRLIDFHFPKLKSSELKYRDIVRREKNWKSLLELQENLLNEFECVTYICDKKFVLILHYVDYAVEPFYYDRDVDLYADGANYALASLAYYVADTLLGVGCFSKILKSFQNAINAKTNESIYSLIKDVKESKWTELQEFFGPLATQDRSCIEAIQIKEVSSDAAFIVLLSLVNRLETVMQSEYTIIHDRSKNLDQYDKTLCKMISHEEIVSFRKTQATTMTFPLKLKSVSQINSKDSAGVQLADVLVGGIIDSLKAITGRKRNSYNEKIASLYRDFQLIHLLPSLNFEEQKKYRKNTEAAKAIEYFGKHFS